MGETEAATAPMAYEQLVAREYEMLVIVHWCDLRGRPHIDVVGRTWSVNGLTPVSGAWVTLYVP
jgi:hypothetical protein